MIQANFFTKQNIQGIDLNQRYIFIMFKQQNEVHTVREHRKDFIEAIERSIDYRVVRLAFIEENEGLLLIEVGENENIEKSFIENFINRFKSYIETKNRDISLVFGISSDCKFMTEIKSSIQKLRRVIRMGALIYPKDFIWCYNKLGPITWFDIPEEELEKMLKSYRELLKKEKNVEALKTLKVYLENNMNYSITADKMFAHINTVRKRVERAMEIIDFDADDYISRLRVIILLQYLGME